jgi:hypothetical protein
MCNLLEHSERDARLQQAKRGEPIYASLADERGVTYEPPPVDSSQSSEND